MATDLKPHHIDQSQHPDRIGRLSHSHSIWRQSSEESDELRSQLIQAISLGADRHYTPLPRLIQE